MKLWLTQNGKTVRDYSLLSQEELQDGLLDCLMSDHGIASHHGYFFIMVDPEEFVVVDEEASMMSITELEKRIDILTRCDDEDTMYGNSLS